ncbi:MAG: hypothetical protein NTW50_05080 [Candidatus Berkelbacteria bacterium]|nr:hypothetical protein [Candidatus Berkelbacteria bacterium]
MLTLWGIENEEDSEPEAKPEPKKKDPIEEIARDKDDPFWGICQGIVRVHESIKSLPESKKPIANMAVKICHVTEGLMKYLKPSNEKDKWIGLLCDNVSHVHSIIDKYMLLIEYEDNEEVKETEVHLKTALERIYDLDAKLLAKLIEDDASDLTSHADMIADAKESLKKALPTF